MIASMIRYDTLHLERSINLCCCEQGIALIASLQVCKDTGSMKKPCSNILPVSRAHMDSETSKHNMGLVTSTRGVPWIRLEGGRRVFFLTFTGKIFVERVGGGN